MEGDYFRPIDLYLLNTPPHLRIHHEELVPRRALSGDPVADFVPQTPKALIGVRQFNRGTLVLNLARGGELEGVKSLRGSAYATKIPP